MSKLVFLDVDGTLCGPTGRIPASTRQAIKQAQANGHKMFVCTGRTKVELTEEILSLNFDGIIGAGGGYCEVGDQVLVHEVLKREEVLQLEQFFRAHQIEYYLQTHQNLFASKHFKQQLIESVWKKYPERAAEMLTEMSWFVDLLMYDPELIDYDNISKICFTNEEIPYAEIRDLFQDTFEVVPNTTVMFGKNSGEFSVKDLSKKTAIQHVLAHLAVAPEHSLGFGDSYNDLPMFEAVHVGIAMGNATPELLAAADDVTAAQDQDGIALAFAKYGLI